MANLNTIEIGNEYGPGSVPYIQSMYGFFRRARTQNLIGYAGASLFIFAMTIPYVKLSHGLIYFCVHQLMMVALSFAFLSKWTNQRIGPDGLPKYAMLANFFPKTFLTSLIWFCTPATANYVCLLVMITAFACAAGTTVTLGPIRRLARQDLMCVLVPGALACLYCGQLFLGAGTVFFLLVVAYAGIGEMDRSYRELISLRATSLRDAEILDQSNQQLHSAIGSLQTEAKNRERIEVEREALQESLIEASREAGKAEIAAGVLHNIGNVMNSVTVTSGMMQDNLRTRLCDRLDAAVSLLENHEDNLGEFFESSKGTHFVPFMKQLRQQANSILEEIDGLRENVDHVNCVVAAQQSYATTAGFKSKVDLKDVIETSLQIVSEQLKRHHIDVKRDYKDECASIIDRQKLIQVLVNLFQNAKHAIDEAANDIKLITIRLQRRESNFCVIEVCDTGCGIEEEQLEQVFQHGFTTRKNKGGHGFGLHHSFLAMEEMGGTLRAESDGKSCGATFIVSIPLTTLEPISTIEGATTASVQGGSAHE